MNAELIQKRLMLVDEVCGRDDEIRSYLRTLARRNNPWLMEEPGVGKTAIAKGIAPRCSKRHQICILPKMSIC